MEKNTISFKNVKYLYPLGNILLHFSQLSVDSTDNIKKIGNLVEKEGIAIFDAHKWTYDIIATMFTLSKFLSLEELIIPVAGYMPRMPVTSIFIKFLSSVPGIKIYPVYRKEERNDFELHDWRSYYLPENIDFNMMKTANYNYLSFLINALHKPRQAVILTPYGSPVSFHTHIRKGVAEVIRNNFTIVFTLSVYKPLKMRFVTYISDVYKFSNLLQIDQIEKTINDQFDTLILRAKSSQE